MLASYAHQAAERFRREQTGQDLVEYGGVLAIIALVIGALYATGFWTVVQKDITSTVGNILSGQGTPPPTK
jgi:Flp pilus assembly pilin Flp